MEDKKQKKKGPQKKILLELKIDIISSVILLNSGINKQKNT